jgi:hypothetical protein
MIKNFIKDLSNIPGWTTKRKLVVFESDDWGSIRMPSIDAFNYLKGKGLDLESGDSLRYNINDTLENADDLSELFQTLSKFKDINENHPKFTAIGLVANPDFEKIKSNKFENYFWEPFTTTLERYNHKETFNLYNEGISKGIFIPQFHGREHINIAVWMRDLKNQNKQALLAFNNGMWGFNTKRPFQIDYQAAFNLEKIDDLIIQEESIATGLKLFEELFGYKASFFVPPNGPFNNKLEKVAADKGIKFMSASKKQIEPQGEGINKTKFHWLGQKNKHKQRYLTRNCFFEPSDSSKDWVNSCLFEIENSFKWKKPAVISTHRVNFIGGLNEQNRKHGLNELNNLIASILLKWPDIEFISSDQLGYEIMKSN